MAERLELRLQSVGLLLSGVVEEENLMMGDVDVGAGSFKVLNLVAQLLDTVLEVMPHSFRKWVREIGELFWC